ncbi:polycystic kidney disease protein 1-like 3 [Macrosteles quadrilineatus]|uniref:polycystic kidney disease protein 1-like 3 n=1 Tax=Macrosteles quadrilineatus TaxID=74068 RepID=UPI0023E3473A|nr:polycystic kidney disease protein 1-like 3 [Macrosteles quadrilineatus]XP_054268195.1 polycystic kidney disease protein 1-like 3 [Macrosteles quadrilineatus]
MSDCKVPENKSEPEAGPSTSQTENVQQKALIPFVSLPKVVLTRLDINNLPVPVNTKPTKKPVKRIDKKSKPNPSKSNSKQTVPNNKHDIRTRGRPKKNYKALAEFGTSFIESNDSKVKTKQPPRTIKKESDVEDSPVKNILKKTMLQKRSKIALPPSNKRKFPPIKVSPKKTKGISFSTVQTRKKESPPKGTNSSFKMDTNDSEDEFLFDELIDEIVNAPKKKTVPEKTTNITLKPNAGNKPPTIVKGGIVKKSSLPPDLKSVASPTSLNSTKHTVISLNVNRKSSVMENAIKSPATAETPSASLPTKASPFPISINSPKAGPKDLGKKRQKIVAASESSNELPPNEFYSPAKPTKQMGPAKKPKPPVTSTPRPRGRPRIGPKQVNRTLPSPSADDESDEYTEVETLENLDPEDELSSNVANDTVVNEEVQIISNQTSKSPSKLETAPSTDDKSTKDGDPHLDLLRILTDETENATEVETNVSQEDNTEHPHQSNDPIQNLTDSDISKKPLRPDADANNACVEGSGNPSDLQDKKSTVKHGKDTSNPVTELSVPSNPVEEETQSIRTIYDLMNDVSLQYPSWNLHIIPETNAFCIAQVTKGRLGLPTLKKCIELDPETYSAKVYIHQYHIKRFDGVYDSEEAIVALIEEIHSIKA